MLHTPDTTSKLSNKTSFVNKLFAAALIITFNGKMPTASAQKQNIINTSSKYSEQVHDSIFIANLKQKNKGKNTGRREDGFQIDEESVILSSRRHMKWITSEVEMAEQQIEIIEKQQKNPLLNQERLEGDKHFILSYIRNTIEEIGFLPLPEEIQNDDEFQKSIQKIKAFYQKYALESDTKIQELFEAVK